MNKCENLYYSSCMAVKVLKSEMFKRYELKRGETPTSNTYSLFCAPTARKLGIKKGSPQEESAKIIVKAISKLWFEADAILDQDTLQETNQKDPAERIKEAQNIKLVLNNSIQNKIAEKVIETELITRKKALKAHSEFMSTFDPKKSTFKDVFKYRANTTGPMAETIVNAMQIVSGNNSDISTLKKNFINESLCLQMGDDLIDVVQDYRKKLPNLLYALTIESPSERKKFEAASMNQTIIDTKKPYNIAQIYIPNTLLSFMEKFHSLCEALPSDRKRLVKEYMATMTHLSFYPSGSNAVINSSIIREMLANKTKIN